MFSIYAKTDELKPRSDIGLYSWFDPYYLYSQQSVERHIVSILRNAGIVSLKGLNALDVGCGYGHWMRQFVKWGAGEWSVTGIELVQEKVEIARRKCPAGMRIECCSADELPFENEAFDIVFQGTVFTSILDERVKEKAAREMTRVVKRGGLILWYDFQFNNPRNHRVRGVKKAEIYTLFPDCEINLRRVTLAPPIGRIVAPVSRPFFLLLEACPFLRTHYLAAIKTAR